MSAEEDEFPEEETGVDEEDVFEEAEASEDDLDTGSVDAEEDPFADESEEGPDFDDEAEGEDEPDFDDLEDIDFGDDDDDDDDEDGEGSKLKKVLKNINFKDMPRRTQLMVGGGGVTLLILLGVGGWLAFSGGEEEKKQETVAEANVPKVGMALPPKKKKTAGGAGTSLNQLAASGGKGASLNQIAASAKGPGQGIVIPAFSKVAYDAIASAASPSEPLPQVQVSDLSESTPQGPVPRIADDGRKPWQVFAKPFKDQSGQPRIAVIVRGLGLSQTATEAAIRLLPDGVTLAFDPYAPDLLDWADKGRKAGHEILITLPLESDRFPQEDPGPLGLMTTNPTEENDRRLEHVLSRMSGYVGVYLVMGSKFYKSNEHLTALLTKLNQSGLMLVDGGMDGKSPAPGLATEMGLPRAVGNVVLDQVPTKAGVDKKLAELEGLLKEQPVAVAVAEAYPASIERLVAWLAGLKDKNISLAPISALADKQILQ